MNTRSYGRIERSPEVSGDIYEYIENHYIEKIDVLKHYTKTFYNVDNFEKELREYKQKRMISQNDKLTSIKNNLLKYLQNNVYDYTIDTNIRNKYDKQRHIEVISYLNNLGIIKLADSSNKDYVPLTPELLKQYNLYGYINEILDIYEFKQHKATMIIDILKCILPPNPNAVYIKNSSMFKKKEISFENLYIYTYHLNSENLSINDKKTIFFIKKNLQNKILNFIYYDNVTKRDDLAFVFPKAEHFYDSIINYLTLYEFMYMLYLNTFKQFQTQYQITAAQPMTATQISHYAQYISRPELKFLIGVEKQRLKRESISTTENAQLRLLDKYLKNKFCLANTMQGDNYDNVIWHPLQSISSRKYNIFSQDYITSYNLSEKTLNNIVKHNNEISMLIRDGIINCFQEVNLVNFYSSINARKVYVMISKDFYRYLNKRNAVDFMTNNNFLYDPDRKKFQVNIYKSINKIFQDKEYVSITNRLSSYDDNKISKHNLTFFPEGIVDDDAIFIGKLEAGINNHNIHTFMAVKINNSIIVNLHLETESTKRITEIELIYLLKDVIPKEPFFNTTDSGIDKIYLIGDLNADSYDIITTINEKVNSRYYKNKVFKIVFNNIITRSDNRSNSALDNCIIIESNKCPDIYRPLIYVSESANMPNNEKNSILSDHSLIAFGIDTYVFSQMADFSHSKSIISRSASKTISKSNFMEQSIRESQLKYNNLNKKLELFKEKLEQCKKLLSEKNDEITKLQNIINRKSSL